jgi:tetratricopeptide (TPR) repeat protein
MLNVFVNDHKLEIKGAKMNTGNLNRLTAPDRKTKLANVAAKAYDAGHEAMSNGDFDVALDAFRWARSADHGNPAYINAEAVLAQRMGNLYEAEKLYLRAIDIAERAFGAGHSYTATVIYRLIGLYEKMGRHKQTRNLCNRIIDHLERDTVARGSIRRQRRIIEICRRAECLGDTMHTYERSMVLKVNWSEVYKRAA